MTLDSISEQIAQRAAEIVLARIGQAPQQVVVQHDITRRLNTAQAAKHLGISVRKLHYLVGAGKVAKHFDTNERPYYILGELDGMTLPKVKRRAAGHE